jgi:hypothetical protein
MKPSTQKNSKAKAIVAGTLLGFASIVMPFTATSCKDGVTTPAYDTTLVALPTKIGNTTVYIEQGLLDQGKTVALTNMAAYFNSLGISLKDKINARTDKIIVMKDAGEHKWNNADPKLVTFYFDESVCTGEFAEKLDSMVEVINAQIVIELGRNITAARQRANLDRAIQNTQRVYG